MINNEEQENKIKFQRQVIQMLYEYKFDNIIYLIQEKYPSYANNNPNIIYILMKFCFIKIILYQQDLTSAKDFYTYYLIHMMKKIYGEKSSSFSKKVIKYNYFLNQLSRAQNKCTFYQNKFKFDRHLDKFINVFEKSFNKQQRTERNPVIFNVTKFKNNNSKEKDLKRNNTGKILFKTEHTNILMYNNENMSELEDELFKLNLEERQKNIFISYSPDSKNEINNDNIINDNHIKCNINTYINNTEEGNISDISYNSSHDICGNKKNIKKHEEKTESSLMNNGKQTFLINNKIRRVNLCKKIVRKFKKYLKKNIKEINYSFWTSFCRENYLPPFKTEEVEFKSFSRIYLKWLFTHEGGIELYNQFIRKKGEEELNKIYADYGIEDSEDKITIKNFFVDFAIYFSNLKITENNTNSGNNSEVINNNINKGLFCEPDLATNLFGNFDYHIREEDEDLSIGSIKEFNHEEIINNSEEDNKENKECIRDDNTHNRKFNDSNKMSLSSDSSNSSMENINTHCNLNINKIYKSHVMKFPRYDNPSFVGKFSKFEDFSINQNKKNEIYPDINIFEYDYYNKNEESNNNYIINKEEENDYNNDNKKFNHSED